MKQEILASTDIKNCPKPPIPQYAQNQNYVFISYSHKDYKSVYCDLLEFYNCGVRFWYDSGLPAGKDWDLAVKERLQDPNCAGVIFYMSQDLFTSQSVVTEIKLALRMQEDGSTDPMNYFCINLTDKQPSRILRSVLMEHEEIDSDWITTLMQAFRDKATYISKEKPDTDIHVAAVVEQMQQQFNVIDADMLAQKSADQMAYLLARKDFVIREDVITGYTGSGGDVILPEGITAIGDHAFGRAKVSLFSGGIGEVDRSGAIVRVVLPDSVRSIGDGAFANCKGLTQVNIPSSVTSIGNDAFRNCEKLMRIHIPAAVTRIGEDAFFGCRQLREITVAPENPVYRSDGNCLIHIAQKTLLQGCDASRIPQDGSLSRIGEDAFFGCEGLVSITIPEGISRIGKSAFSQCVQLEAVSLPESLEEIAQEAFFACRKLKNISLPSGLEIIGKSAFRGCKAMEGIQLPQRMEHLGAYAFMDCAAIAQALLPTSIKSVPEGLFSGCENLWTLLIPEGILEIGPNAFFGCRKLQKICIPKSVEEIYSTTFADCIGLEEIRVQQGNDRYYVQGNCLVDAYEGAVVTAAANCSLPDKGGTVKIGAFAFLNRKDLVSFTVPEGYTHIEESAFRGCSNLRSIILPDSICHIGRELESFAMEIKFYGAFSDCCSLTEFRIPKGLHRLPECMLEGCSGLTYIEIPETVRHIGRGVFGGCTGLKMITIPPTVRNIDRYAFLGCKGTERIVLPSLFADKDLYFPKNCTVAYV